MKNKIGLTEEDVLKNREKYGNNDISTTTKNSFIKKFMEALGDPIIRILIIALGIKMVFLIKDFDWFETVGIVIAIFLASFISTISEYGSEQAFIKLQEEASKIKCKAKRDNKVSEISISDVVVNDIILLESGDKIPADGILIGGEISVDESSLTGETKEIHKIKSDKETEKNRLLRGSTVYSGVGTMLVLKVGHDTLYGKLANELRESAPDSPLKIRLHKLAQIISYIGYVGAVLVSFSYLFSVIVINNNFDINAIKETITNLPLLIGHILYALTLSVTIIVVAVPEGLPMMITLVLSSNMKRMLRNNVLVRKLVGIETAGSLNILFTDKTGTLTKGQLEVISYIDGDLNDYHSFLEVNQCSKLGDILSKSIYCNNSSTFDEDFNIVGGNSTDKTILKFLNKPLNINVLSKQPFDSKNKYSTATIYQDHRKITLIKGAPEKIVGQCTRYYHKNGYVSKLFNKSKVNRYIDEMTKKGIRVVSLAVCENNSFDNMIFLGLLLIKDEIREEAKVGIEMIQNAHINTVMITGDNKETATTIGREVGLLNDDGIVLTSSELNEMADEELKKVIPKLKIVARALPQDKSRLVKVSQELGLVVGMTGDGVNDAPAIKKADVGFAMGSGTEVTKEAADIVVLDDNIMSIGKAILFGRSIFKSIRKFIIFQLTLNMCAISLSIVGPFIGIDTPITVIQMLWVNMVMDTLAGLAFSFEPPLLEYMKEYPKKKEEPILNKYMLQEIFITGLYSSLLCIFFLKSPFIHSLFRDDTYFMSAFFGLFIFTGIFNCFNARTERLNLVANIFKNKIFLAVIIFVVIVQLILIYYGGDLFRTAGLTLKELEIMILLSATVIPFDFLRKIAFRKKGIKGTV